MLLSEYLSSLVKVLDKYSSAGLISDSELHTDFRTEKIGLIGGAVTFSDNSRLVFSEYLDLKYKPVKLSYSFHYQKQDATLVFRYDNARHKPPVDFLGHKHLADGGVVSAEPPSLKDIFVEIMDIFL